MSDYVFDIEKCDVEAVVPIPAGSWLPDTNVPNWPADIQAAIPQPPPTLNPDWPCPVFPFGPIRVEAIFGNVGGFLEITPSGPCGFAVQAKLWTNFEPFPIQFHQLQCCQDPYVQWTQLQHQSQEMQLQQQFQYQLEFFYPTCGDELEVITGWQVAGTDIQVKKARIKACIIQQDDWITVHQGQQCQNQ